ncbi:O-acyltransferase like protein-like isoform X2 [Pomacea canaliculata]|uniref:O-acyltransferase like protein-like isoform X2 n=1 Tax=Pomacea canaliculata TaxID=400727 RepID=UPI000D7279FF|nr:O-acyltransferase like protein-like isoform X2 [Pomacea canaliculata]
MCLKSSPCRTFLSSVVLLASVSWILAGSSVLDDGTSVNLTHTSTADGVRRTLMMAVTWPSSRQAEDNDSDMMTTSNVQNNQNYSSFWRCIEDLVTLAVGVDQKEDWAVQMRDASASVGEGLAPMELDLMGVASECVSVEPPRALLMKAKYCSLSLQTPFAERMNTLVAPFAITSQSVGLCVPASCDEDTLRLVFRQKAPSLNLTNNTKVNGVYCEQSSGPWKPEQITLLVLLCCWICLLLVATCFEVYTSHLDGRKDQSNHQVPLNVTRRHQLPTRLTRPDDLETESTSRYIQLPPPLSSRLFLGSRRGELHGFADREHRARQEEDYSRGNAWPEVTCYISENPTMSKSTEDRVLHSGRSQRFPLGPSSSHVDEEERERENKRSHRSRHRRRDHPASQSDSGSYGSISYRSSGRTDEENYFSFASISTLRGTSLTRPPGEEEEAGQGSSGQGWRNKVLKCRELCGGASIAGLKMRRQLVKCLSFSFNISELMDTHQQDPQLGFLHGLRACAIIWIVFTNTLLYIAPFVRNSRSFEENVLPFASGSYGVDFLLALRGVVSGFVMSQKLEQTGGRTNWLGFYIRRFWRLMPTMVLVGVVYVIFFPSVTSGPLWTDHAPDYSQCKSYWWANLLLVQNFLQKGCMPWTWYLAVEWQLHVVTPPVLILLQRWTRWGVFLVACLVTLSCVTCGVLSHVYNLPLTPHVPVANVTEAADYISVYLRRPYTHAPSYFLPLLVGYVLHKRKFQSPLKLLPTLVTSALCIASVLAVVLGPACYSKGGSSLPLLLVVVYHALSHTVWALALSWLLFLYANGNLNVVSKFMSWSGWIPICRLTYSIYLVHPIVIFCYTVCLEQFFYFTFYTGIILQLGILVISIVVALAVALLVEMPLSNLEVLLSYYVELIRSKMLNTSI